MPNWQIYLGKGRVEVAPLSSKIRAHDRQEYLADHAEEHQSKEQICHSRWRKMSPVWATRLPTCSNGTWTSGIRRIIAS